MFCFFKISVLNSETRSIQLQTFASMLSKLVQVSVLSGLVGFGAGAFSIWFIIRRQQLTKILAPSESPATIVKPVELLHWNPLEERRGLGDLIEKVNHIALIVSDVGRSLNFYVDTLGFQQIRRPNFYRHGAWLTMGNIELHLIKGIPVPPSGDHLIVGHIALETSRIDEVLLKLRAMNIEFRQNISVPDTKMSRENRFEGPAAKGVTGVIQYFFTDPDGYYLELCNCDILTEFCLNREKLITVIPYHEGIRSCRSLDVVQAALRWKRKAKQKLREDLQEILAATPRAFEVNEERFKNLQGRRFTYGDMMQAYTDEEIKEALLQAHNFVPLALRVLSEQNIRPSVFQPPSFYENGKLVKPDSFIMTTKSKGAKK